MIARRTIAVTHSDLLWGAVLLLRRELLDELGGFDERFFLYAEEVDLCRRAWAAGWAVTHVPAMTIEHRIARRAPDLREYLIARGQLTYARKRLGPGSRRLSRSRSSPGASTWPPTPVGRRSSVRGHGSGSGER